MLGCILSWSCQESWETRCAREAEETTRQCPQSVDEITLLDSLTYDKQQNAFIYHYSLEVLGHAQEVEQQIKSSQLIEEIKKNVINSPEMKLYKEHNVIFIYNYQNRGTWELLGSIMVTPADYNL